MIKMRKITKIISLMFVALFAFVFLTACGGDHDLVGTWAWERDTAFVYTFNSDGTGTRGDDTGFPTADFEWRVDDDDENLLLIECSVSMFGVDSERWDFTIEDDAIILTSLQGGIQNARYVRQ